MTDRGVIFSGPMVRALIEGRKRQTRRLARSPLRRCEAGDRLYVREAFFVMSDDYGWSDYVSRQGCKPDRTVGYCADRSDGPMVDEAEWEPPINAKRVVHGMKGDDDREAWTMIGNIPSIYMPRWASRLTLIVARVRQEPLQSISREDCVAEGHQRAAADLPEEVHLDAARDWYMDLWDELHDRKGERWRDNPSVVALEFEVIAKNIDRL